jgi:hypothetical protein
VTFESSDGRSFLILDRQWCCGTTGIVRRADASGYLTVRLRPSGSVFDAPHCWAFQPYSIAR